MQSILALREGVLEKTFFLFFGQWICVFHPVASDLLVVNSNFSSLGKSGSTCLKSWLLSPVPQKRERDLIFISCLNLIFSYMGDWRPFLYYGRFLTYKSIFIRKAKQNKLSLPWFIFWCVHCQLPFYLHEYNYRISGLSFNALKF